MLMAASVECLVGYDCHHENIQTVALNLMEPGLCPNPTTDFHPMTKEQIQVIQVDVAAEVIGYVCSARATKFATYCGRPIHPHVSYGQLTSQWEQLEMIDEDTCWNAVNNKVLDVLDKSWPIVMDVVHKPPPFMSHGMKESTNGQCYTEDFITNNVEYKSSYQEVNAEFKVSKIFGARRQNAEKVKFYSDLNQEVDYEKGTQWLDFKGRLVWSTEDPANCSDHVRPVYEGKAETHKRKGTSDKRDMIVVTNRGKQGKHMGLVLGGPLKVCGQDCHTTDSLDGFAVCFFTDKAKPQFLNASIVYSSLKQIRDLERADFKSYSDHQTATMKQYMDQLFRKHSMEICDNRRRIIQSKLHAMSGSNNEYALFDLYGPGYQVVPAGPAVAYVIKCVAVQVVIIGTGYCSDEVPVVKLLGSEVGGRIRSSEDKDVREANKTTLFMDPVTRVLKKFGTPRPCSEHFPIRWFLDEDWYCSKRLGPVKCSGPQTYHVDYTSFTANASFLDGLKGLGFTTPQMMKEMHTYIDTVTHDHQATAKVATHMIENADGHTMGSTLSRGDYSRMQEWTTPTWIYSIFGTFSNSVTHTISLGVLCVVLAILAKMWWSWRTKKNVSNEDKERREEAMGNILLRRRAMD